MPWNKIMKETKDDKENTREIYVCNSCGNSFIYEEDHEGHDPQFRSVVANYS